MSSPRNLLINAVLGAALVGGSGQIARAGLAHGDAAAHRPGSLTSRLAAQVPPGAGMQQAPPSPIPDSSAISVQFFSTTGASLSQLSHGDVGAGWLVYYLPDQGLQRPGLVVRLANTAAPPVTSALVFAAPPGSTFVPIQVTGEQVALDSSLHPAVSITSKDGWWVREGQVSYNLNIQVSGPIYSMWGGAYDPKFGTAGWVAQVPPNEASVEIQVRDPEHSGIPAWDLRTLVPKFEGRAYDRTNYAERMCGTPTEIDLGPSPLWPYVAASGSYEQVVGKFRPPIVVDWATGHITHFSELVTVRNQNCSYSLYSVNPVKPGPNNQPDFETPFAFYDLSGQGTGFPNLILRTERYPVGDLWATGMDSRLAVQPSADFETVRYSWRDAIGDQRLDYKVEVLGFYPYSFQTPIADGLATIDAPPYAQFPQWVVDRTWPIVTFVAPEAVTYVSTEGIYEWSPRQASLAYALGRQNSADPLAFTQIPVGLRGEYRLDRALQPWLYYSPIDNRLHLVGANAGLWNLGNGQQIRTINLDGGSYINAWVREESSPGLAAGSQLPSSSSNATVLEALYALPGYLLYSGPQGVVIRQATYAPASFTILPPTDHATWLAFNARVEPLRLSKRDPNNLASWLMAVPGQDQALAGATVQDVRLTKTGFRFVLDVGTGYAAQGNQIPQLAGLQPGQYLVAYAASFTVEPLRPAEPVLAVGTLRVSDTSPKLLQPVRVEAVLANAGSADLSAITVQFVAHGPQNATQIITTEVPLLAGVPAPVHFDWTPTRAGEWRVQLTWSAPASGSLPAAPDLGDLTLQVQPQPAPGPTRLWQLSNVSDPIAVFLLLTGIALSAAVVAIALVRRGRARP